MDAFERSYLFDGFCDFFSGLVNRAGLIVLNHNDLQENNILMGTHDNEELVLIDLEYACRGPIALDLASFLNETVFDN